jgi:chemotaxis protein MotB
MLRKTFPLAALLFCACSGAQLRDQQKTIDLLQAKSDSLAVQLKDRTAQLDALKAEKSDADAKLADAESKLSIATDRADGLAKSNKDLSDSMGASQNELSDKVKSLIGEKDELARQLSEAQKEKLTLTRARNAFRMGRDKTAAERDALAKQRDELAARFEEQEKAKEREATAATETRQRRHDEMGTLADVILKEIQAGRAFASVDGSRVEVKLSDALLFDGDSATLTGAGETTLQRLGMALKELGPRDVRVEAHDNAAPVKRGLLGGFEDHWALSSARAAAAARVLQTRAGLDPARLSAVGDAQFHAFPPDDETCADNRCLVIFVDAPATP